MQAAMKIIATVALAALLVTACSRSPHNAATEHSDSASEETARAIKLNNESQRRAFTEIMEDESKPASQRLSAANTIASGFPGSAEATRATTMIPMLREIETRERIGMQWSYERNEDKMTGKVTSSARVTSTNYVSLGFPYAGNQRATLVLRRHPIHGNDVIFSIERGQLLCRSYSGCPLRLRFDDNNPFVVQGTEPSDHSTEVIFLPGFKSIASRIGKSKKLLVEVGIYQNGSQIFEFDVAGFDQGKLATSTK